MDQVEDSCDVRVMEEMTPLSLAAAVSELSQPMVTPSLREAKRRLVRRSLGEATKQSISPYAEQWMILLRSSLRKEDSTSPSGLDRGLISILLL
ncbi:hypothetical protein E3H11_35160 [Bradyrhizobium brasilense]|uniref:hypothetical protein n=1 Tax=Bradyrhizobium brasilense TaxID=1419277 RepID=UPI00145714F2|nr:hypothetical protein [Bradyrhizobium brasilense]NLS74054.1 hypothetical protein [Bradyrhizobium brasilense]